MSVLRKKETLGKLSVSIMDLKGKVTTHHDVTQTENKPQFHSGISGRHRAHKYAVAVCVHLNGPLAKKCINSFLDQRKTEALFL